MAFLNIERQMPSEEALQIITKELSKFSLVTEHYSVGDSLKTYHCKLIDLANKRIFWGCGKGIGVQSQVSATFEAYEHYLSYTVLTNKTHPQLKFMSCSQLENFQELINLGLLPKEFGTKTQADSSLPWLRYENFRDQSDFYFPLFMVEPRYLDYDPFDEDKFNYHSFQHLGSDSGTASGTSFVEAAIHGLNECVERDATSLFLLNTFIKKYPVSVVDKGTLPQPLQQYIQVIEAEFADELIIVNITSSIGIATFFASFSKQQLPMQPKGYGSSLYKSYALERAILEALQIRHLHNADLVEEEKRILKRFEPYPLLRQAALADLSEIIANKHYQLESFKIIEEPSSMLSLEEQLEMIIRKIEAQGLIPRFSRLNNEDSSISCLKVMVPQFDNFFLVSHGKFIMPNKRNY